MLQFFRKYQKIFFVVITFVIVVSFSFFGTYSTLSSHKEASDSIVTTTVKGEKVSLKEIKLLSYFLDHDYNDDNFPNFFNDQVLQKDVFQTKLADELASEFFPFFEEHLKESLIRVKNYHPYRHPKYPFFGAEMIWGQYVPEMMQEITTLQKMDVPNKESFTVLSNIYLHETKFPPYLLKAVLLNSQRSQSWMEPDPFLEQKDFHLFGFKKGSDWFGKSFIDLVAQVIINVSDMVEKDKMGTSYNEAKADLQKTFVSNLKRKAQVDESKLADYYARQLSQIGMNEKQVVTLWQKICNFRKYFNSLQNSVLMDQTMWPCEMANYSVEKSFLPSYLQFTSFKQLLEFDLYLMLVSNSKGTLLPPKEFLKLDEIVKRAPELVERTFQLKVKEVTQKSLKASIPTKQMWQWQLKNYPDLSEKFVFLTKNLSTRDARFEVIQKLSPKDRSLLDDYTLEQIINNEPDIIAKELENVQPVEMELSISFSSHQNELVGIEDYQKLKKFLLDLKQGSSSIYSDNKKAFYQFEVIETSKNDQIMTFERAQQKGVLHNLLEKVLEEKYSSLRTKDPGRFQNEDGKFKSLEEAIEDVGLSYFQDFYAKINKKWMKKGQNPLEFYTTARLADFIEAVRKNSQNWENLSGLAAQWNIQKETTSLSSKEAPFPHVSDLKENELSQTVITSDGPMFFKVLSKTTAVDQDLLDRQRQVLSSELLKKTTQSLVHEIKEKNIAYFDKNDV
ncbi:MAG: hypothetical protein PVI40_02795 [Chlamydiota bacterium]|jgi:GcvH upstream region-like protein